MNPSVQLLYINNSYKKKKKKKICKWKIYTKTFHKVEVGVAVSKDIDQNFKINKWVILMNELI